MRFASKVVPLGALGLAAAFVVACGDANGLLSGSEGGGLQDALASVQSACAEGQTARAERAAQSFSDRVASLPPGSVDPRLIDNLQRGAATLDAAIADGCTASTPATTDTTPTTTTETTTTPTTTTETTTTPTTPTEPTTPTTPTTPPTTPPTTEPPATTPPDTGGGASPPSGGDTGSGGVGANPSAAPGRSGGVPPGQAKKGFGR